MADSNPEELNPQQRRAMREEMRVLVIHRRSKGYSDLIRSLVKNQGLTLLDAHIKCLFLTFDHVPKHTEYVNLLMQQMQTENPFGIPKKEYIKAHWKRGVHCGLHVDGETIRSTFRISLN